MKKHQVFKIRDWELAYLCSTYFNRGYIVAVAEAELGVDAIKPMKGCKDAKKWFKDVVDEHSAFKTRKDGTVIIK